MEANNNQTEEQDVITDLQLVKQDESTVKILQEDDLKTVKDALVKVSSFKRKYTPKKLAVTDIESKEQKEKLRLAIADLRTTRTDLDKVRKAKVKPYQETIAFINENYNKAIEVIEQMETPLKLIKKDVDEKIEAKEKEAEIALQNRVNDRIKKLIDAGSSFDGSYYSIGSEQFNVPSISLGIVDIQTMTDAIFENVLAQVIDKAAIIAEETEKENLRVAEEKRLQHEKEAEEKRVLAEQQLALKQQQEEFQRQQDEFKKQQNELKEAQDLMAKMKQEEADRVLKAEQEELQRNEIQRLSKITAIVEGRKKEVYDLGLTFNNYSKSYTFGTTDLLKETDVLNTENDWATIISETTKSVLHLKEENRIKKENEEKEQQELIAAKAIADNILKDKEDERIRQEELVKKGDKAIYEDFISRLKAVSFPEVKSKEFKDKIKIIKDFIADLK